MGNMGVAKPNQKDLMIMKELLEAGKVKPVIDRYYPLDEVADALRYLEEGHAQGKIVIIVEPTESVFGLSTTKITSTLPAVAA